MSSSLSQSQVENSIDSSRFSEIKQLDIENNPQQTLQRLRKDYQALQTQYDEAMSYVQQMDDIHRQLGDLTKENTRLKSEKDEVERRLQIALQVNEELNSKLQNQKIQAPAQQQTNFNSNIKLIYEQEKIKSDEQIKNLNQSLSEAKKSFEDQKAETEKMKENLKQIFDAFKNKFNKDFDSAPELIEYISNMNIQNETDNASTLSSLFAPPEKQTEDIESKIKDYKHKYTEEKRNNKQLQKALKKISKKNYNLSRSQEYEVNDLNDQINDLQNIVTKKQQEHEQKIKEKEKENEKLNFDLQTANLKIDDLTNQLQQQKQKYQFQLDLQKKQEEQQQKLNEVLTNENSSQTIINQYKENINDLKTKIEEQVNKTKEITKLYLTLKKQYIHLNQNLDVVKKEKSDILIRYQTNESQITQIINENNQLKEDMKKLQFEKDDLEMQSNIKDSSKKADQIKIDKANSKVEELLMQVEKFKTERSVFQSLLEMQKKEISSIYQERDNIFNIIRKQSSLIKQCENQVNNLSNEKTDLIRQVDYLTSNNNKNNNNNNFMNSQPFENLLNNNFNQPNPIIPLNQLQNLTVLQNQKQQIPLTAWTSADLPGNLIQPVLDIGKKENLAIEDRIQKVISKISQFYNSELLSKEESLKKITIENENCMNLFQQFVDSICNLLGEKKVNAILMNPQTITLRINQITKENSQMLNDITKFDNSIQSLFKKLNVKSFPEALQEIENMLKAIQKLNSKFKKQKAINRKLIEIVDSAQNESFEKQSELENIILEQKRLNESSLMEKDSLSQENNELKSKYQSLVNDFESFKSSSDETIQKIKSKSELKLNDLNQKYQNEQESLLSEIMDKENKIKELNEVYKKTESSLEKCLKSTAILKNNYNSQQIKIKQLQSNFNDMQNQYKEKLAKEKEIFHNNLNKTIEKYKNKNESLRILLDKATSALSDSDLKNKDLHNANNQLNVEKQQLIAKIETQKQEIEREKQLNDSKLKAMQLAVDVQNQSAIEAETAKFERDKRQIFTDIANSFKQFFDARQKLDESTLKILLEKASQELNRLMYQEASLKTLLGLKQGERLEDAVSKLFMSIYNVNK